MSTITMSATMAAQLATMSWGQRRFEVVSRSPFGAQTLEAGVPLWTVSFSVVPLREELTGEWKATLMALAGQTNKLELWDVRRPAPLGTFRGAATLALAASQGATSLQIDGGVGQAGKTLKKGDLLQLGSGLTQQVVMVVADATANGSGVITATAQPPLRNGFALGAAVIWDKPKALFRRSESDAQWVYEPLFARGFGLSLIEDWR